jgi:hypothetical protein
VFTVTVGKGVTDIFDTAIFVQLFVVPVTVKLVVDAGAGVKEFVIDPVFQI